jgi:hypothetical protein
MGMKTAGEPEGQARPAESPFEHPHQVVMRKEADFSHFREPDPVGKNIHAHRATRRAGAGADRETTVRETDGPGTLKIFPEDARETTGYRIVAAKLLRVASSFPL